MLDIEFNFYNIDCTFLSVNIFLMYDALTDYLKKSLISVPEKDVYLSSFSGSNELDIPMRVDKSKIPVPNGNHPRRSLGTPRESSLRHKHRYIVTAWCHIIQN